MYSTRASYLCDITIYISEQQIVCPAVSVANDGQGLAGRHEIHHHLEEVVLTDEVTEF